LSRRIGQKGNVFQHCKPWSPEAPAYGRFWIDMPGQDRQRKTVSLGACRTRSIAKQKLREHIESTGINGQEAFKTNTAPATTFRAQAEKWIESLAARRRKPVKPATIVGWRCPLDKWILPNIGDKPLSDVSNGVVRELVEKMAAKLSPKTIVNYTQVVKLVVASAVDPNGEQLYPRKWNHDFIGLPIVEPKKQRRPTVTKAEVEEIIATSSKRWALLFAFMAATGLRLGEAVGVKVEDLSEDCSVLDVKRSIWHGREQEPKTPNAIRVVDIPEVLARVLQEHVVGKAGYLFPTKNGGPLGQRNVIRVLHATGKKVGSHVFRRFRTETLRRARVPQDLIDLWTGHSTKTITDLYALGLHKDEARRREWCEKAELGFSLVGLLGLQKAVEAVEEDAA
jgi:integrase